MMRMERKTTTKMNEKKRKAKVMTGVRQKGKVTTVAQLGKIYDGRKVKGAIEKKYISVVDDQRSYGVYGGQIDTSSPSLYISSG